MTYTGKVRDTTLPQHEMRQGHFGYLELDEFPDATGWASGTHVVWDSGAWHYEVSTGGGSESDDDLIGLNDSQFDSSLGNWTNSGGTMSRDTTLGHRYAPTHIPASLKLVTTATNQYAELPLTGTFKKGTRYDALLAVKTEETSFSTISIEMRFGVNGGDENFTSWTQAGNRPPVGSYQLFALSWTPLSDISSSVVLRFKRAGSETGTQTWHIGWAKVLRVQSGPGLHMVQTPDYASNKALYAVSRGQAGWSLQNEGSELLLTAITSQLSAGSTAGGIYSLQDPSTGEVFTGVWGENADGDRNTNGGFNIEVGNNYIGIQFSQKDSSTLQVFPDDSSHDIVLTDGNSPGDTVGWYAEDSDGNRTGLLSRNPWRHFSSDPSGAVEGDVYWNDTSHKPRVYDGSTWHDLY